LFPIVFSITKYGVLKIGKLSSKAQPTLKIE